ncbi:hypothetical protein B0H13DRAFT_2268305 [Mycena leptocephala]|nr:hypothetical protein B0H13DRAFT_2268305 [Mycena leptocephala]
MKWVTSSISIGYRAVMEVCGVESFPLLEKMLRVFSVPTSQPLPLSSPESVRTTIDLPRRRLIYRTHLASRILVSSPLPVPPTTADRHGTQRAPTIVQIHGRYAGSQELGPLNDAKRCARTEKARRVNQVDRRTRNDEPPAARTSPPTQSTIARTSPPTLPPHPYDRAPPHPHCLHISTRYAGSEAARADADSSMTRSGGRDERARTNRDPSSHLQRRAARAVSTLPLHGTRAARRRGRGVPNRVKRCEGARSRGLHNHPKRGARVRAHRDPPSHPQLPPPDPQSPGSVAGQRGGWTPTARWRSEVLGGGRRAIIAPAATRGTGEDNGGWRRKRDGRYAGSEEGGSKLLNDAKRGAMVRGCERAEGGRRKRGWEEEEGSQAVRAVEPKDEGKGEDRNAPRSATYTSRDQRNYGARRGDSENSEASVTCGDDQRHGVGGEDGGAGEKHDADGNVAAESCMDGSWNLKNDTSCAEERYVGVRRTRCLREVVRVATSVGGRTRQRSVWKKRWRMKRVGKEVEDRAYACGRIGRPRIWIVSQALSLTPTDTSGRSQYTSRCAAGS